MYEFAYVLSTLNDRSKAAFEELKAKKEIERGQLLALELPQLQAMRDRQLAQEEADKTARIEFKKLRETEATHKAAKKEATKIYNQESTNADFKYWATMDHWTFDESVALLLGKEPRVLTRAVLKRELVPEFSLLSLSEPQRPKSEFLRRYEDLREIAGRAIAMQPRHLRPIDVVLWASHSGAIEPPNDLVLALVARVKRSQPKAVAASATPNAPPIEQPNLRGMTAPAQLKRAALVQKYARTWATIETDLRHANENGLSASSKSDKHGYWNEDAALGWARKNGKVALSSISKASAARTPFDGLGGSTN